MGRINRWRRITMTWPCHGNLVIDVPKGRNTSNPPGFILRSAVASNYPNRAGELVIVIERTGHDQEDRQAAIHDRLTDGVVNKVGVQHTGGTPFVNIGTDVKRPYEYRVKFSLNKGDNICIYALKLMREVLKRLGIPDPGGHRLSAFEMTDTLYLQAHRHGNWIPHDVCIRIDNSLPFDLSRAIAPREETRVA